jgi:hypothetical protein
MVLCILMRMNMIWLRLKSVIAASEGAQPALPWTRGNRRKPEAVKTAAAKTVSSPEMS